MGVASDDPRVQQTISGTPPRPTITIMVLRLGQRVARRTISAIPIPPIPIPMVARWEVPRLPPITSEIPQPPTATHTAQREGPPPLHTTTSETAPRSSAATIQVCPSGRGKQI